MTKWSDGRPRTTDGLATNKICLYRGKKIRAPSRLFVAKEIIDLYYVYCMNSKKISKPKVGISKTEVPEK